MDIWSLDKITLVITFAIPGFITLKTYGLLSASGNKDTSQQVLDAVAYSCINYAILAFPILSIEHGNLRNSSPYSYFALWAIFLLVFPAALAGIYWWFRKTGFAQRTFPHPIGKSWDFVFSQKKPYWIVVVLKNGRKVGGWYGIKSFASSYPYSPDLYIEESYHINEDGGFDDPCQETAGILITESEISTIEFFKPNWSNEDEREETSHSHGGASTEGREGLSTPAAKTSE